MAFISATARARIEAQIATKEAQLAAANTAYTAALGSGDVESYSLDTKEGKQATTLRSPAVLLKAIQQLESEINRLYRRLEGGGICNLNLRRG
jgi:hypothetical protein